MIYKSHLPIPFAVIYLEIVMVVFRIVNL